MNDIFVRLIKMPETIHAFIMEDAEGDYNIYINEGDPDAVKRQALDHELQHIVLGHLHSEKSAMECEDEINSINVDISAFMRRQNRPFQPLFLDKR